MRAPVPQVRRSMSIRTKLALTLFLAVGLFLSVDLLLLSKSGTSSFRALERSRCEAQVAEIERAFDAAYSELASRARQADLKATQPLMAPKGSLTEEEATEAQEEVRAIERAVSLDDSDLALTLREDGKVVSYRYRMMSGQNGVLQDVPNEAVSLAHPFMKAWMSGTPPRGLLETREGPMMIGSAVGLHEGKPVLHVRGQRLDAARIAYVQGLAGSTFECKTLHSAMLEDDAEDMPLPGELKVDEDSDERLRATTLLNDVRGIPVMVMQTSILRNELKTMEAIQRQELLTAAGVAILFPLVLLVLIQIVVTGPLGRLTAHASAIGKSDDAAQRLNMKRGDEIGVLAAEFDRMLDELERSRRAQQKIARMSGRSDVATGVMHGVGNLVNSVNVSAQLASQSISGLALDDLRVIQEALVQHLGDLDGYLSEDPQGQHLLQFFGAALDGLESKFDGARNEVSSVVRTVEEVTSLVQSLRSEETREVVLESVNIAEEVNLAIERAGILQAKHSITCRAVLDSSLEARLDRQRLEEVLDAVLVNAKESLQHVSPSTRELRVRAKQADDSTLRISVEDTGTGIAQEDLESIFALNSTTKGEGRGRGLHMASIGAKELGGELSAWSEGQGKGAIFTLELPVTMTAAA